MYLELARNCTTISLYRAPDGFRAPGRPHGDFAHAAGDTDARSRLIQGRSHLGPLTLVCQGAPVS